MSPQSRGDPREHFLPTGTCRTLYARLTDFLFCLLDSGIEGLDMLGKKVHLKYRHKPHCASQRKELFFVFLIVYSVGILTTSACGEHEAGVLDPCFFLPFQSP